ncbi:dihydrofolate reductase family protein [Mesorhizobium sp. M8A.F.Ca.ET.021.01.1.1]|uniref:dihydrofolate reductase family protein n=1 Tax=Mesorhizobium sp. M8A.F.Ca.ET.021.01.1.1 TaxID=2496757 RepID=UPI000FCA2F53|nr:dihydrofolate reductase family protein [Mesorhizobium sp. M8A.F.Ca.ET.021.01.1.1]RUW50644.1 dihydrofolate reductase [Mesorhizobium sp. M8A.F.Ca.ET.021.01.1.1]
MRRLIVSSFVSLDGVIEGPMTWASPFFVGENVDHALQALSNVEFFLLGRVTYEMFFARWPDIRDSPYMDRINGLKKLVASTTLKTMSWNATLLDGDVVQALAAIKRQPGGDILKYGVSQLDRTLLGAGLVDEYHLSIVPTWVGHGKRAFDDVGPVDLDLVGTHRFANGVVTLTYVPR